MEYTTCRLPSVRPQQQPDPDPSKQLDNHYGDLGFLDDNTKVPDIKEANPAAARELYSSLQEVVSPACYITAALCAGKTFSSSE